MSRLSEEEEGRKTFKSLEVREASSSHFKKGDNRRTRPMYFATSTTIYIVKNFLIDKYERVIIILELQSDG